MTQHGIPTLELSSPNGIPLTRIQAEKELWDKCKTSHMMRRLAWGQLGLDGRFAWMLKPTSVTHWILDELIRKKQITGEPIGVQPELDTDDSYFNSFVQRLIVFVQDGRALQPKEGEGIDMSDIQNPGYPSAPGFNPPPPPGNFGPPQQGMPQPQQFAPQQQQAPQNFGPPPQGMPQFGPPGGQQQPPPQQYQQPPSFPPQGMPPVAAPPQQMAPPPQQQFAPQPQQGFAPPPQQQLGQPPAPQAQAPSNRRRAKADAGPPPGAAPGPLPGQATLPFPASQPPGFGTPPGMSPAQFGQPPAQQMAAPQGHQGVSNEALQAQNAELKSIVQQLSQQVHQQGVMLRAIDMALSIHVRGMYNRPAEQLSQYNLETTFKEIGLPYPS